MEYLMLGLVESRLSLHHPGDANAIFIGGIGDNILSYLAQPELLFLAQDGHKVSLSQQDVTGHGVARARMRALTGSHRVTIDTNRV